MPESSEVSQEALKMVCALMCGTSIRQLQATVCVKVFERMCGSLQMAIYRSFSNFFCVFFLCKEKNNNWKKRRLLNDP